MPWPVGAFCGLLGWLVVLQSAWCNPLAEVVWVDLENTTCHITQKDGDELRFAVQADDGFVYDAAALRTWLQRCREKSLPTCVIPNRPIGVVKAVRLRGRAVSTTRCVGTQTDAAPCRRRIRPPPRGLRIPSCRSAFHATRARF